MRSSFIADTGQRLVRTPSPRRQAARRRVIAICALATLALAGGAWGYLSTPRDADPQVGPFSYFPD